MPIYLFYVSRAASPKSFEAYDLADDEAAMARAPQVLEDHVSCTSVEVCINGRTVGTLVREDCVDIQANTEVVDGDDSMVPPQLNRAGKRQANTKVASTIKIATEVLGLTPTPLDPAKAAPRPFPNSN